MIHSELLKPRVRYDDIRLLKHFSITSMARIVPFPPGFGKARAKKFAEAEI